MHRLDLLSFVPRGNLLRALHGLLRFDGHFFKSQHTDLVSCRSRRKRGWHPGQPLNLPLHRLGGQNYLPAAAAAAAGAPTLTLICFGLASSFFGMLSVSTPF